ncbi:uncharacterized protein LOC113291741 [Papaver somniferum]|uniref:uncharacterized protein LOC113291741 n=1 Tax=Papaver somniferum TaxID=3469 RepID=UPI000E6F75CD|nr:uncharacterized protein LOC113291741 [Papaver somniferum]
MQFFLLELPFDLFAITVLVKRCAGTRWPFGEPLSTCARVSTGQVLLSIRCKGTNGNNDQEAPRLAKFKFLVYHHCLQEVGIIRIQPYDPYLSCEVEVRVLLLSGFSKEFGVADSDVREFHVVFV